MAVPMNILLVEDNDIDAEIFQRGLAKFGSLGSLIRKRDGQEALEFLKEDVIARKMPRPYVVLLDINMPRMNGHDFLQAVRNDEELRDERIIVFTTSNSQMDVEQAYQLNANGYVVKPTGSKKLSDVLDALHRFWEICEDPA